MTIISITFLIRLMAIISGAAEPAKPELIRVDAEPMSGFHSPYFLFLPSRLRRGRLTTLLIEPNNSGKPRDDLTVIEADAQAAAAGRSLGASIARTLGLPYLVPAFPRPQAHWRVYSHALDGDSLHWIKNESMKRIDLQLKAMIVHARFRLSGLGIPIESKVFLNGFSASGSFVNRFTFLHPDLIKAVACGGLNGLLMLPVSELKGRRLCYPLGLADYERLMGHAMDLSAYRAIPQFIYMGESDDNDAVGCADAYEPDERETIYAVLGSKMMPDRFLACREVYLAQKIDARFEIFSHIGHRTDAGINEEITRFFQQYLPAEDK